jgi:hypothetical protein
VIKEKDFKIEEEVTLNIEQRLLRELARPFGEESATVSGLELTSKTSCLIAYKQFMCRYNFPLCEPDTGLTHKVCSKECIIFNDECGMPNSKCSSKFFEFMDDESKSCEFAP